MEGYERMSFRLMRGVPLTGVPVPGVEAMLVPAQLVAITARGVLGASLPWFEAMSSFWSASSRSTS